MIPTLDVAEDIIGVPWDGESWKVEWLWNQVGYLEGTAFPTWQGNTLLSAHAYLPSGEPGPFAELTTLKWDDEIYIYANGSFFIYKVRESYLASTNDQRPLQHEDKDWITLLSCKGFDPLSGSYRWRQVVRAVLVEIR
jgi:LPXTG-site transpeptidase (sortase) family protein